MPWISAASSHLNRDRILELLDATVAECRSRLTPNPRRVLLLPPDITRMHSGVGWMTEWLYHTLSREAEVHLIPTLGQHEPHTPAQNHEMFGAIPHERIHPHDWRDGVTYLGDISAEFVREATHGAADWNFPIWLNQMLMQEKWDWIINIGHVVPHEVLGFANHNKNYFIGLGGKELICASHMAAACCGIENNLGNLITPVRQCFNQAENDFLRHLPDTYIQVVLARNDAGELVHTGYYAGDDLETYLAAARQSRQENITVLDRPLEKVVCVMQGDEFFSTWVANKAVYRTRMAIADGGDLIIIAPGLKRFGEQPDVDALIRRYGYCGTPRVMELYRNQPDMRDLAHATAHLIHGSSEGRFQITYAPGRLQRADLEQVGFQYADLANTIARYNVPQLSHGWNTTPSGEQVYFIPTPSAGLWATRAKLFDRATGFGA